MIRVHQSKGETTCTFYKQVGYIFITQEPPPHYHDTYVLMPIVISVTRATDWTALTIAAYPELYTTKL